MADALLIGLAALLTFLAIAVASRVFLSARARSRRRLAGVQAEAATPPPRTHDTQTGIPPLEHVQFTVYRPREVTPREWSHLLAFVHLAERRVEEPDSVDPLHEVRRQAERLLGEQLPAHTPLQVDGAHAIPRSGELVIVPRMQGMEFNPAQWSFRWEQPVHRADFSFRALEGAVPRVAGGHIAVFWGTVIIGEIPLTIRVAATRSTTPRAVADHSQPYRRIFASYSRHDHAIVQQFENFGRSLGDEYLRDVHSLRAGETWSDGLETLIRKADIFQLFWSWNALRSPFVRQELEYALALERENFVRPVYWEEPLPAVGDLPPARLRQIHFYRVAMPVQHGARGRTSIAVGDIPGENRAPGPAIPDVAYRKLKAYAPAVAVIVVAALAWPVIRQYRSMADLPAARPSPPILAPPTTVPPPQPNSTIATGPPPAPPPTPSAGARPNTGVSGGAAGSAAGGGTAPSTQPNVSAPPAAEAKATTKASAPPPPRVAAVQAEAEIKEVLERYRAANEARDVDAVRRVFPAVHPSVETMLRDVAELRFAFAAEPEFVNLDLTRGHAVVQVPVERTETRGRVKRRRNTTATITLSKVNANNRWVITSVLHERRD